MNTETHCSISTTHNDGLICSFFSVGLKEMAIESTPLVINSPSAGNDENTTWGWFNIRWSNYALSYHPPCCVFCGPRLHVNFLNPKASAQSVSNTIMFIVQQWQRWIIQELFWCYWISALLLRASAGPSLSSQDWAQKINVMFSI